MIESSVCGPTAANPGCYDFGGIAVSMTSDSQRFMRLAEQRYGRFATDEAPAWRLHYLVTESRPPAPRFLQAARQQPMSAQRQGRRLRLQAPTFRLDLDHAGARAELAGPLATYPVDRMIQALCYETWDRGLIIHGAALAEGDRGWLASGPSGSGKSTLASLFPEHALCDEFAAVRLDGAEPRLAALPFWKSRRGGASLSGIYLLRHGRSDHRRRLKPGEAFARLRREVQWPTFDPGSMPRALDTLAELLRSVPIWELAFRPTRGVWRVIGRNPS